MITTSPASIRVDTRYALDLTPITSRASISSLYRVSAHAMSRTPMTANQPSFPASSSGLVAASPKRRTSPDSRGKRERSTWRVDTSAPRSESHTDGGQHHVDREQRHHAEHDGLVDRGAQPLGAAAHRQPAVAADQTGDHAEGQ